MSEATRLRERFRQARQKRAQERVSSLSEGGVKRPRQTTDERSFVEATSTTQETTTKATEADTLSKEELDRILMPPPGPLKNASRRMTKEHTEKPITAHRPEQMDVDGVDDVVSNEPESCEEKRGVPDDFFEIESKKSKGQLEKERTAQRNDAEYLRFQQELDASMTSLTEKEAEDEEESERHRQEMDAYEQQRRLGLVQEFKEKRRHLPISNLNTREQPPSTSGEASTDDLSLSDDEEDVEQLWRGKKF